MNDPAPDVLRDISTLVADARGDSMRLAEALKRHPAVEAVRGWTHFRLFNFDLQIEHAPRQAQLRQILETLAPLDLVAAPEIVAEHPLAGGQSVLVLRHRSPVVEKLAKAAGTSSPFETATRHQFRRDMQALVGLGLVHPHLRGYQHWLVGATSGRIFLEHWDVLRPGSLAERVAMMTTVDQLLHARATGSRIERVFHRRRALLPVIHPVTDAVALASVATAVAAGCAGAFLINQGMSTEEVLRLAMEVRARHPSLWLGINLLGATPIETLERGLAECEGRLDGIWADDAGIEEHAPTQVHARAFVDARAERQWQGLYFGGVAFKYQRPVADEDLATAARASLAFMDVVCSSGPGTGQAADVAKVTRLREGLGPAGSLALASGVTEENIGPFLPHVDAFLVGTGIERSFGVLDPEKVSRLQRRIDEWTGSHP